MIVRERRQIEKKLGREQKQQADASKKDYRQAWLEIKDTEYPKRPDEMEQFFLAQITQAEQLVSKGSHTTCRGEVTIGPSMYLTAAQYFYKALKVYPSAPELLDIYKKTVPEVPCRKGFLLIVGCIRCNYGVEGGG
jgi:mitochondrial import receptor subunit TOM20